ncbi:hypothetical protein CEUSTIGMA_g10734.t1 [Chlamydomonas eustigma]|uniref:Uncharacterized protein n=1 Tax=Chlamydomonas eustigma TaxID=1157962 RepID=A0A250XJR7_9CHLO|nr:hypothetical protein CEUSTIGMA_g10734.t1 [Chlamydomonas eustigma]|eukprot:GAX83308.1 hypothetical protein CEUSTIGMA_g10734.t1 [Chlamydomonas eustigma]
MHGQFERFRVHCKENMVDVQRQAKKLLTTEWNVAATPWAILELCSSPYVPVKASELPLTLRRVQFGSCCLMYSALSTDKVNLKMLTAFLLFKGFYDPHDHNSVDVVFVPLLGPKSRIGHGPLGPGDVNSGVASIGIQSANVFVFREEECTKVLLHELVHSCRLDFVDSLPIHQLGMELHKKYNIKSRVPIRLNETYAELLASLLDIAIRSELGINVTKKVRAMADHFVAQADRVMCASALTQDTHVFEYYVAKASLMFVVTPLGPTRRSPDNVIQLVDMDPSSFAKELSRTCVQKAHYNAVDVGDDGRGIDIDVCFFGSKLKKTTF